MDAAPDAQIVTARACAPAGGHVNVGVGVGTATRRSVQMKEITTMRLVLLLLASTLLTACALPSRQGRQELPPRPLQRCDAEAAQWAVGKTNTEHNVNEARKRAGAYMVRVVPLGQPATSEFNAERLNLEVDATGHIVAARCG